MDNNLKEKRVDVLAQYLNIDKKEVIKFDDRDNYFEIVKNHKFNSNYTYKEGWFVYTKEEREKLAREYLKDMIKDECYNHYKHLEPATGMNKEELIKLFKPYDNSKTASIENVYDFLMEHNELDKYIEIILADTSFDHYKEQLSPSCFEGGEQDGYYIYQWC